jgi:hypothetical protein
LTVSEAEAMLNEHASLKTDLADSSAEIVLCHTQVEDLKAENERLRDERGIEGETKLFEIKESHAGQFTFDRRYVEQLERRAHAADALSDYDGMNSIEVLRLIVADLRSPTRQHKGIRWARANWLAGFTDNLSKSMRSKLKERD